MAMDFDYNQVLEHVDLNCMISASMDDGVLDGLNVGEDSPTGMDVDVSAGSCYVGHVKYAESGITNLVISTAHASYARKDIIVYDTSAGVPAVISGTAASIPQPPYIPHGDIILALVDVAAAVASISNTDITDKRIIVNRVLEYVELDNVSRAAKSWGVINGLSVSENGTPDMSVDVASGTANIDDTEYTESSTVNVAITAADSTYARRDIIIYDASAGNPVVVDGVASAHPVCTDIPVADILLAIINVPANVTTILNSYITDKRLIVTPFKSVLYASDNLQKEDNSEEISYSTSYVKIKDFSGIPSKVYGTDSVVRVAFQMRVNASYGNGYIAKNGVQIGTMRRSNSITYNTYEEDISSWGAGDTIELWIKHDLGGGDNISVRNFKVSCDFRNAGMVW